MQRRRYKKERPIHEMYLVFCEGKTEKEYVEALKRHYRLPITVKTKVSGADINQRFVNQCVKELQLPPGQECRIFYIYDADVKAVVEKLQSLDGTLILSNPCVELWFLLHSREWVKRIEAGDMVRMLMQSSGCWKTYRKGCFSAEQQKRLIEGIPEATERARRMKFPANPSSNVYIFIEALERAKEGGIGES